MLTRTARVHVFMLHHDQAHIGGDGSLRASSCMLMLYVDAYQEGAVDVPWEEWGPMGMRFFVLAMVFQWFR